MYFFVFTVADMKFRVQSRPTHNLQSIETGHLRRTVRTFKSRPKIVIRIIALLGNLLLHGCYIPARIPDNNSRIDTNKNSSVVLQNDKNDSKNASALPQDIKYYTFAEDKIAALKSAGLFENYLEVREYLFDELLNKKRINQLYPFRKERYGNTKPDSIIVEETASEFAEGEMSKKLLESLTSRKIDVLSEYFHNETFLYKLFIAVPLIVIGEVIDIQNDTAPADDGFSVSIFIKIQEIIKGQCTFQTVILRQRGSYDVKGNYNRVSSADPHFIKNDSWVLFLSKTLYFEKISTMEYSYSLRGIEKSQVIKNDTITNQMRRKNDKYVVSAHSFRLSNWGVQYGSRYTIKDSALIVNDFKDIGSKYRLK